MTDNLTDAQTAQANVPYGSIGDIGGSLTDYINTTTNPLIDRTLQQYIQFQQGQQKPLDIYNTLESLAGLPQLRKTSSSIQGAIGNVEDALKRVEPNVSATTRNSIVTEAQRQGMVQAQSNPLQDRLTELNTGLGRVTSGISQAESNLGTKAGLVMQGQSQDLSTYKLVLDTMSERAAQLISGFGSDQEYEYKFLMDKITRQRQLTDQEYTRLVDLQKMKVAHDYQLDEIKAQADEASKKSTAYQFASVGSGSTGYVFNPATGGVTSVGGGGGTGGGYQNYYSTPSSGGSNNSRYSFYG